MNLESPIEFINNCKIRHPTKGITNFQMFEFQEECVKNISKYKHNIVCKARQIGMSTIAVMYAVWLASVHRDSKIAIIASRHYIASHMMKKILDVITDMSLLFDLVKLKSHTKQRILFSNGSSIKVGSHTEDFFHSETFSFVVADEVEFFDDDFNNVWLDICRSLTFDGRTLIISTPNKKTGKFYNLYQKAETGENDFHATKLEWHVCPDRGQDWLREQIKYMTAQQASQELMCEFV